MNSYPLSGSRDDLPGKMIPATLVSLLVLIVLFMGCGSGVDEVITTLPEEAGSHQLWSSHQPRLEMSLHKRDRWSIKLPLGSEEGGGPVVTIEADSAGILLHHRFWIGAVESGIEVPVTPYPDHPGYFKVEPLSVAVAREGGAEGGTVREVRIAPLIRARGDSAIQFRYSAADVMRGYFPAVGREFILYDGNGNGIYEAADLLVIDQNGDGLFDGNRNSVERYAVDEPFLLGDHSYRFASVAPDGASVHWVDSDIRPDARIPLLTGDSAPDFELPDLQGNRVRFSEASRGRPVLLSYWATW